MERQQTTYRADLRGDSYSAIQDEAKLSLVNDDEEGFREEGDHRSSMGSFNNHAETRPMFDKEITNKRTEKRITHN